MRHDRALTDVGAFYRRFLMLSPDFVIDADGRVTLIEATPRWFMNTD